MFVCLAQLTLEMKSVDSNSQEIVFAVPPQSFIVTMETEYLPTRFRSAQEKKD